jgi:hypothetical protein
VILVSLLQQPQGIWYTLQRRDSTRESNHDGVWDDQS